MSSPAAQGVQMRKMRTPTIHPHSSSDPSQPAPNTLHENLYVPLGRKFSVWDLHYFVPFWGVAWSIIQDDSSKMSPKIVIAKTFGLLSALLLAIIAGAFIGVGSVELQRASELFSVRPYGCLSSSSNTSKGECRWTTPGLSSRPAWAP